jgi:ubiquinone/menaquinone biosynthesis C-methylase UbiE
VIYRLLDHPSVYRLSQSMLAPGGERMFINHIGQLLKSQPQARRLLDVGSGPSSWLSRVGLDPIGLDVTDSYMKTYRENGGVAVRASADRLPLAADSIDAVWTMFLLHHLPDDRARRVIQEMVRVCAGGGCVVVIDAVMPRSAWTRPFAYAIRRLDRGRHMRTEQQITSLLPDSSGWTVQRNELCRRIVGSEMLTCIYRPPPGKGTGG